jgi:hypothetical protein
VHTIALLATKSPCGCQAIKADVIAVEIIAVAIHEVNCKP